MARVLVVDDEPSIRKSFASFLKNAGHRVWTAGDGSEALEVITKNPIDVLVSDIVMPTLSGTSLMQDLQKSRPGIEVILVTGQPSTDSAVQAVRADAHDYLSKPVSKGRLCEAVDGAALRKAQRDANQLLRDHRDIEEKSVFLVYGQCEHGHGTKGNCLQCTIKILSSSVRLGKERMRERAARELGFSIGSCDEPKQWASTMATRIRDIPLKADDEDPA